ncbi:MAG: LysR family transcriptional regulator [Atopobiaceae bacterium]|jgi:DNA-binding transcriptional LysR family regulator|nr:LysR family transcriptional regulator [Atopobiaceae bacterium]MCH4119169.1 LysR family transcriptional regulator [Atopobiaceae bacterium]MCI1388572.1 LysR family transcriptional regulator [Atopobiaceae bacterium]MCI1432071.1 LysR family transcriptional regulator [Atopobiaceae bacterium]MCI1470529.1 LysR family transcriptional regulator [Atopobiaceae bacterium]
MNLRQLEYFRAIAEEGKITAAARRLRITQPPLSYELASLERELGVTLVTRGPRGVELTDAGKVLYERAGAIMAMTQAAESEVRSFGEGVRGVLSIGMVSSSGGLVEAEPMARYAREYPQVEVRIHEGNTFAVLDMLERGVVDVGVVRTPFPEARLECRYAEPEPMAALVPASLPLAQEDGPVRVAELDGVPLVFYRRFEQLFRDAFAKEGASFVPACVNDDARTTCIWARAGYGVGLVPKTIVQTLETGGLTVREVACEALVTRIAVVTRRDRYLPPVARTFCEAFAMPSGEGARQGMPPSAGPAAEASEAKAR